ncbi:error-prone DNA polymerase [Pararhizobium haloflavum]|uniref:error-prone DNA polymerase n=1 Tax=Pararhizobium haloflavum TaxID=2037914 RepID=UPI000C17B1E2|nr:error-prone DNA polymerase [Pararhizobium haloflavum]
MSVYAELAAATNFSFLRGASPPQDMVLKALELGHAGIAIADCNTVAGVVRAYSVLKELNEDYQSRYGKDARLDFKLMVGARLVFSDGTPDILAYPENRAGWGRLCRLLTKGKMGETKKGSCILRLDDLKRSMDEVLMIVMPGARLDGLEDSIGRLSKMAPGAVWLGAAMNRQGDDHRRLHLLKSLGERAGVPLIALNDVLYHAPEQRPLQDILTCIRTGKTIETAGRLLEANAERYLKPAKEMERLFREAPEALDEIAGFMARIDFSLDQLKYDYPEEPVPPGKTPQGWLEELTWRHAGWRYPQGVPDKVAALIEQEFALIAKLDYARYFLTIYDIVRFANSRGILCQGRGSAANSAVCYVLGITSVDPATSNLLFARFLSEERREPPDIDVDFEHERREEVIQYLYDRYGRLRAGIAATVIHYRPRSAIREVGKVFGLTEDVTARLAGMVWGSFGDDIPDKHIRQVGLDPQNPVVRRAVDFAKRLLNYPRHLSQHVGGFVLTNGRLDEMVPIGNAAMADRTFIEWDKDDIDTLGLMKVDVLALGMLTCIRKCFDLLEGHEGEKLDLASVKQDDHETYAMLRRGDSIGVFQVESRAQINMLPRLKPKEFYDLVIQVAIVRPGPIQGDMVHPYLRRRDGLEKDEYPSPAPPHDPDELKHVLSRTLGVPLFQEQAMQLAITAAEFTPEQANGLRKAMATFRHNGTIGEFEKMMIEGMVRRGYERAFAERCFAQIRGFGEYGFPESHAASFARLVYVSAFIKRHYPAIFACGLLNSQPMGFYAPAQIVRDARDQGVKVWPVDVNFSADDNTLERDHEGALALRLGFRQIDGWKRRWSEALLQARGQGYESVETLWHRAGMEHRAMKMLADADGFRSLGLDRREGLWAVRRLPAAPPLPLFAAADKRELGAEPMTRLPAMPLSEHVVADYQTVKLSLKAHPMAFLRERFGKEGIITCEQTGSIADGAFVRVAGVVLVRQRPGKGNAIFMTLEDETGIANVLLWARRFERYRSAVMGAKLALVEGRIQKSKEGVVHLMATAVLDRTQDLQNLSDAHAARIALARADEVTRPQYSRGNSHPRDVRIIPRSRDFH